MLTLNPCSVSCGVFIIGGETQYQTPSAFVKDFFVKKQTLNYGGEYTQFVFTHCTNPQSIGRSAKPQTDGRCMGDKIEEFVKANNLGVIVRSAPGTNPAHPEIPKNPLHPNVGYEHKICVWVWTIPDNQICIDYLKSLEKKCRQLTERQDVAGLSSYMN